MPYDARKNHLQDEIVLDASRINATVISLQEEQKQCQFKSVI